MREALVIVAGFLTLVAATAICAALITAILTRWDRGRS